MIERFTLIAAICFGLMMLSAPAFATCRDKCMAKCSMTYTQGTAELKMQYRQCVSTCVPVCVASKRKNSL